MVAVKGHWDHKRRESDHVREALKRRQIAQGTYLGTLGELGDLVEKAGDTSNLSESGRPKMRVVALKGLQHL